VFPSPAKARARAGALHWSCEPYPFTQESVGAGLRENGGLRGSGSASAETGVLHGRRLREDRAGRLLREAAAREAHPAKALHHSAPAPWGVDPTTAAEPHLPPCTARGRPSRLPDALHLRVRGTGTRTPPGPHPHARSHTGRSKRRPRPPPPRNCRLLSPPPWTRTLRRPCAERWPGLVTVIVLMLPWSVPLWVDDSMPSRQRGTGGAHPRWRWTCR
jgi:hypothetical protein